MKFSIKNLRTALNKINKTESNVTDTYTDDIMNDVDGSPFALSESNVLYAGLSELAGYHYFKTIIIGTLQVKTFKGATLCIDGTDFQLELKSDMNELESEATPGSNRRLTRIDFEIYKDDISKISKDTIALMTLVSKKNRIVFSVIEGGYDEGLSTDGLVAAHIETDPANEDSSASNAPIL